MVMGPRKLASIRGMRGQSWGRWLQYEESKIQRFTPWGGAGNVDNVLYGSFDLGEGSKNVKPELGGLRRRENTKKVSLAKALSRPFPSSFGFCVTENG